MKLVKSILITSIFLFGSFTLISGNLQNKSEKPKSNAKNPDQPNILFCISDDQSFPHASAYGCSWVKTPSFDRVAQQGILFTNAYTPNAKCAPSRAVILTGRNSWQLEEAANHVGFWPENKYSTYCEALLKNGYIVAYTGKGWEPGNPRQVDGKPRELTGKSIQSEKIKTPTKLISDADYAGNFETFLNEKEKGKPWCFWYGGREPHRDYEYGSGVRLGGKKVTQIEKVPGFWPDNDSVRNDMLDYAFEIEYFDSHLGRMIKVLEDKGELQNTIIVVTADNGMPFPRSKGIEYEISTHLPLAIMWPMGIKNPGRKVDAYISFVDFAPTFLETAGIKFNQSGMESTSGRSLTDIFNDKPRKDRSFILLGQERHDYGRPNNQGYPIRSIVQDGFLYLYNFKPELWPQGNPETGYLNSDGGPTKTCIINLRRSDRDWHYWELCLGKHAQEELYQINVDRDCMVNLAGLPIYDQLKQKMKQRLFAELKKQMDPRVLGNGDVFDKYPFYMESSENFYERYMNGEIKKFQTNWVSKTDYEKEKIER